MKVKKNAFSLRFEAQKALKSAAKRPRSSHFLSKGKHRFQLSREQIMRRKV